MKTRRQRRRSNNDAIATKKSNKLKQFYANFIRE